MNATESDLMRTVESYAECALWASMDESNEQGGEPFDTNYTIDDIHQDTWQRMEQDVARFVEANGHMFPDDVDYDLIGYYLWLSRNGHGHGFFARSDLYGDHTDELQDAARKLHEVNLYIGDDGMIHGYPG